MPKLQLEQQQHPRYKILEILDRLELKGVEVVEVVHMVKNENAISLRGKRRIGVVETNNQIHRDRMGGEVFPRDKDEVRNIHENHQDRKVDEIHHLKDPEEVEIL